MPAATAHSWNMSSITSNLSSRLRYSVFKVRFENRAERDAWARMKTAPDSAGANSRLKLPRGGDGNGEDFVQAGNGQQTCRQVQRGRPSRRRGLQPADRDDRPRRQAPANAGAGTPMDARLAPRQAPSVIGAPPRRALFGFQGARKRGRRAHARARPCFALPRALMGGAGCARPA